MEEEAKTDASFFAESEKIKNRRASPLLDSHTMQSTINTHSYM